MTDIRITSATRRVIAACALAMLIAVGGGAALADGGSHNGSGRFSAGGPGHCMECTSDWSGDTWSGGDERRHHRPYPTLTGVEPPLHGPGSSHDPIVDHPSGFRPPVVKVGPAKPLPSPVPHTSLYCRDHRGFKSMPNVRDHRNPYHSRCGWPQ